MRSILFSWKKNFGQNHDQRKTQCSKDRMTSKLRLGALGAERTELDNFIEEL